MGLSDQKCTPPGAGDAPFSLEQAQKVTGEVRDWALKDSAITREFQFNSFSEAMTFVNKVADVAQEEGHHPDIFISYKMVRLTLSTHRIGGLSQNDFIMAAKVDRLLTRPLPTK